METAIMGLYRLYRASIRIVYNLTVSVPRDLHASLDEPCIHVLHVHQLIIPDMFLHSATQVLPVHQEGETSQKSPGGIGFQARSLFHVHLDYVFR